MVLVSYLRIYLGIDFTDEALYSAIPYRFVLGDRPFVDEWNLTQASALFTFPLFYLFSLFSPDGEWWMLFARHLGFFLSVVVAGVLYRTFASVMAPRALMIACTAAIAFVPYGLLGIGYNALGSAFFTLGICAGWNRERKADRSIWLAGVCHGVAVCAYPTLILACLVYAACFATRRSPIRLIGMYVLGGLSTLVGVAVLYRLDPRALWDSIRYVSEAGANSEHDWGMQKLWVLAVDFWNALRSKGLLAFHLSFWAWAVFYKKRRVVAHLVLLLPFTFFYCNRAVLGGDGVMGFLRYFAFLAPFAFVLLPTKSRSWPLLVRVWLPVIAAGCVMAWSSNMKLEAFAVPILPAVFVALFYLGEFFDRADGRREVLAGLVVLVVLYSRLTVYMDDPLRHLRERIPQGVYRGLFTTALKKSYLESITQDVRLFGAGATSIVFQPHFPAGYLLSKLRPAAPSVWGSCPTALSDKCREYFATRAGERAIVVTMQKLVYATDRYYSVRPDPAPLLWGDRQVRELHRTPNYIFYETLPKAINVSPRSVR